MNPTTIEIVKFEDGQYGVRRTIMEPKNIWESIRGKATKKRIAFTYSWVLASEKADGRPSFFDVDNAGFTFACLKGNLDSCQVKLAWIETLLKKPTKETDFGTPILEATK